LYLTKIVFVCNSVLLQKLEMLVLAKIILVLSWGYICFHNFHNGNAPLYGHSPLQIGPSIVLLRLWHLNNRIFLCVTEYFKIVAYLR
jgi:hypothetical protein